MMIIEIDILVVDVLIPIKPLEYIDISFEPVDEEVK